MANLDAILADEQRFEPQALAQLTCTQCEARPSEGCVTKTGNPAKSMHRSRWAPLAEAFAAGYNTALPLPAAPAHT